MIFSPQQIKFEFLSYLKEFGCQSADWRIGVADDAEEALFVNNRVDRDRDVWLWKPALSAAAANIVLTYFQTRHGIAGADQTRTPASNKIFIFKRAA